MRIIEALSQRSVRLLWAGQVFSAVGDEIYNVALVWYATDLIGLNAGYISAVQAASVFIFSLIGGMWVDHHDDRKVMIVSDLVRGFAVLLLPLSALMFSMNLWILVPTAVVVASLSAFFNPALRAFLPSMIDDQRTLETTNGLMETTNRLARVIGPGLIGALSRFVPVIHYFTLDAISFFGSAWSIAKVRASGTSAEPKHVKSGFRESLSAGFSLTRKDPLISYFVFTGGLVGSAWLFVYPLGIALFLRERITSDVGALGSAIFGYGLGNLASNLVLSNFSIARPAKLLFWGRVIGGVGFTFLALSHSLAQVMAACAVAAIGGPMTDLGFINLLQRYSRGRDLVRIYRFKMAIDYGSLLLVLLLSPSLFRIFSVPNVITACAIAIFLPGVYGLIRFTD